jgi:hypothetical protein
VWRNGELLVSRIEEMSARHWLRPVAVDDPLPGTFGQALSPLLDEWNGSVSPECAEAIRRADLHIHLLATPESCIREGEGQLVRARELFATARALEAGPPAQLWRPHESSKTHWLNRLRDARRLTSLALLGLTRDGKTEEALEICREMLAFSRDIALGTGRLGISPDFVLSALEGGCAKAIEVASIDSVRKTYGTLQRVHLRTATMEEALEFDGLMDLLDWCGDFLTESQLGRLPSRPPLNGQIGTVPISQSAPFRFLGCPRLFSYVEKRQEAARTPENYPELVHNLNTAVSSSWNPMFWEFRPDAPFANMLVTRYRRIDTALELLRATLEARLEPWRLWSSIVSGTPAQIEVWDDGRFKLSIDVPDAIPREIAFILPAIE